MTRHRREAGGRGRRKNALAVIVISLFAAACLTPAVYAEGYPGVSEQRENPARPGIIALLFGWAPGLPGSNFSAGFPACIPWSANWLFFFGWGFLLADRFKTTAWLGGAASLLALGAWATSVQKLLMGYYLWHGSMLVLMIGAMVLSASGNSGDGRPAGESLKQERGGSAFGI